MKKTNMATPWTDPRTGMLCLRRAVPDALRPAFAGKAEYKVSLRTKNPADAKIAFARENAVFEQLLADARRRLAEGTLLPTPSAVIRRWSEGPGAPGGLSGRQRLLVTLMALDATVAMISSANVNDIYPPATFGPAYNIDWAQVLLDESRFETILGDTYSGQAEQVGSNWIRTRWHQPADRWMPKLTATIALIRSFDAGTERFSDDELAKALLAVLDDLRSGDDAENIARLVKVRSRPSQSRLRPAMGLRQLYAEWKSGRLPRPQSALEFKAAVDDFLDFVGDIPVSMIDVDMLYDYRDEAQQLPASMARADRALPFRARVEKHRDKVPKCSPPTVKKRIGALQALLTYAFRQRWIAINVGAGILIDGYSKSKRTRRSFEDHELALLCGSPLFTEPSAWQSRSRIRDSTIYWLFLFAITTGARLEEIGQSKVADVKRDGDMIYLDIDDYIAEGTKEKHIKTEGSKRLLPVHRNLVDLGFLRYCDALTTLGHTELFPDLTTNIVDKRTKEASQRANRIIDRYVSSDTRLVFHSLRHAFKAKGNDAGLSDRTLDQICGHAPVTTGSKYGSEPRIKTIHRDLHKIDFSCIAWDALRDVAKAIDWIKVIAPR